MIVDISAAKEIAHLLPKVGGRHGKESINHNANQAQYNINQANPGGVPCNNY